LPEHQKRKAQHKIAKKPVDPYEQRRESNRRKQRKLNYMFAAIALIILLLTAYGIWQYYETQQPPEIGGSSNTSFIGGIAPDFKHYDINGNTVKLSDFKGDVIALHFMAVGCGGQIYQINDYQLRQLTGLCSRLCANSSVALLTVAVATCENSALNQIRDSYGITWTFGNDYEDKALDIIDAYVPQGIGDGTVVLIDKAFNIVEIYRNGVAETTLASKINTLLLEA